MAAWSAAVFYLTLGVVVGIAGGWAWLSFVAAGLIALTAGYSYVKLSSYYGERGGAFTFLRKINATLFATARLTCRVAEDGELPAVLDHRNAADVPDRAVILLGTSAAVLAAVGTLTSLVEAASLSFLFTFAVVCGLAFFQRVGLRVVTGFGALAGATASVALIVRLISTDPLALVFLGLLVLIAIFGRPLLLRHVKMENRPG